MAIKHNIVELYQQRIEFRWYKNYYLVVYWMRYYSHTAVDI